MFFPHFFSSFFFLLRDGDIIIKETAKNLLALVEVQTNRTKSISIKLNSSVLAKPFQNLNLNINYTSYNVLKINLIKLNTQNIKEKNKIKHLMHFLETLINKINTITL